MLVRLSDIKQVLPEYDNTHLSDWAKWLHENFYREPPELRIKIFGNLVNRLNLQRHGRLWEALNVYPSSNTSSDP